MDGVRSLAQSLGAEDGGRSNLFRTLGPALFISIGYIDLGKWVTTVDAGSRFGYDLVLLVLLFNFSAVLCQYLSICIGMVTTKNLAQVTTTLLASFFVLLCRVIQTALASRHG
uniref:Uncharacterized protein n=1 Tax=Aegilops tauschii subsp. strangulata TaxID=200361 RepID=A0A453KGH0_AEGTS